MPDDKETLRNITDYYEYSAKERAQNPDVDWNIRFIPDTVQAAGNTLMADVTLKGQIRSTGERYELPEDKIGEFLKKEYQDRESREYLVDGAILTCTNCTKEEITINAGGKELPYYAKTDTSIDTALINNLGSGKVAGRLIATDNPSLEANGLIHATVADSIGRDRDDSGRRYNIPNFGNCLRKPDSRLELEVFEKIHNEADDGLAKRKEGSCKYLMKLEEEWENFDLGQSYCTFYDDMKGTRAGITMTSMLFCRHGGFIYPVTSGQTNVRYDLKKLRISSNSIALSNTTIQPATSVTTGTQKKIQNLCVEDGIVYFDESGYQRVRNTGLDSDPYLVALAEYYQSSAKAMGIGDDQGYGAIFKVTFYSGGEIYVTMGDLKAPKDTMESQNIEGENFYAGAGQSANTLEFFCNYLNRNKIAYSDNMTGAHGVDVNTGKAKVITGGEEITSIELLIGVEIEWEDYFGRNDGETKTE